MRSKRQEAHRQDSGQRRRLSVECDMILGCWDHVPACTKHAASSGHDLRLPVSCTRQDLVARTVHRKPFEGTFTKDGQGRQLKFVSFSPCVAWLPNSEIPCSAVVRQLWNPPCYRRSIREASSRPQCQEQERWVSAPLWPNGSDGGPNDHNRRLNATLDM